MTKFPICTLMNGDSEEPEKESIEMPPMMTIEHAAKIINCEPRTIYNLIEKGFPVYRIGGMWRVDPKEFKAWLSEQKYIPGSRDGTSNNQDESTKEQSDR